MPYKSMFPKPGYPLYKVIKQIAAIIPAVLVLLAIAGCSVGETPYFTVKVPINYQGLSGISSLHLEMDFDDRLMAVESAEEADGIGGIFTYGMQSDSRVIIGIAGIAVKGSGTIAYVNFKVRGDTTFPNDVVMSNVAARDLTGNKIDLQRSDGSINPVDHTFVSPVIKPLD
jgi:hypothetical protein